MFRPDTSLDLPIGCDLLAEIGVDRRTVGEIAEYVGEPLAEPGHARPARLHHRLRHVEADRRGVRERVEARRRDGPVACADVQDAQRRGLCARSS